MININDYTYDLPQERIALFPLDKRDESKLLIYRQGFIEHSVFKQLSDRLPVNAFLFFNDTKVIPARLHFQKETGAVIEIFLLSPISPSPVISETMAAKKSCQWKCTIGNLKRWTSDAIFKKTVNGIALEAKLINRENGIVELRWNEEISFAEIIEGLGETPLPPYLKRKAEESDKNRYQTIYSHYEGAVAAPTAGLHFTPQVFDALRARSINHDFLTLHVSAGTFQPVKTENVDEHEMHSEQIVVTRKNLDNLLSDENLVIAVGTTSMRTIESLYWFGCDLLLNSQSEFRVKQTDPYRVRTSLPSKEEAIQKVIDYMIERDFDTLVGETAILIKPGYDFKICKGLITNFHQPGSTLMLLVAAFVGNDWKKIYKQALENDYRFLSFGDSSLLLP